MKECGASRPLQVPIARAGALQPLVALVEHGHEGAQEAAARALWNLAVDAENKVRMML